MPRPAIAHPNERNILHHYSTGMQIESIAGKVGLSPAIVRDAVARLAQYNRATARTLVAEYDAVMAPTPPAVAKVFAKREDDPAHENPTPDSAPAAVEPAAAADPQPSTDATAAVEPRDVEQILTEAEQSGDADLQGMARRIRSLLAELDEELSVSAEERALAKEVARLRLELAEKERLLNEARAATPRPQRLLAPAVVPDQAIRKWAWDKGIDCPRGGRLPSRVRDQYMKAHP